MTEASAPYDVQGQIARLFVYPVKSCAGVEVREAPLTETGLDLDRAWMVVDEEGVFLTQRELPRMALVRAQIKASEVVLRAPGMLALHLQVDQAEQPVQVRVWRDTLGAYSMGDLAAQWFSDFLSQSGSRTGARPYRLVRFDPEQRRLANMQWTAGVEAQTQFVDGFPLLVASQASLDGLNRRLQAQGHAPVGIERFRPNIVLSGLEEHDEDRMDDYRIDTAQGPVVLRPVKPCVRCPIPNIDPQTAESDPAVGDTLQTYRQDPRMQGGITFAMNAIIIEGLDCVLELGQAVRGNLQFQA